MFTRSFCVGRGHALPRSSCSNPPTSPARPFPSPPPRRKRPQTKPNEASLRFATSREPNKKKQKMAKRGETSNGTDPPAHQRSTRERGMPQIERRPSCGRQYLNPEVRRLCPSNISPGREAQGVVCRVLAPRPTTRLQRKRGGRTSAPPREGDSNRFNRPEVNSVRRPGKNSPS